MFTIRFQGLRIAVSLSAARELAREEKTMYDVLEILDVGYNAPRKRKEGTLEKWLDKRDKTYNAVIARDYDDFMKEEVWVLIHFGKFTKHK
ncbi:hypothetical protein HZC30_07550 [Candidatus Woesearchaeota archaeon]|nr:hypothetical protein [Candidatus Woesearchaeota archaeon]